MKTKQISSFGVVLMAVIMATIGALSQTSFASHQLDNFSPIDHPAFSSNPLLLNNRPLDYSLFSITSKGVLSVVAGQPGSAEAVKIPFRAYLKRNGMILMNGAIDSGKSVHELDISRILANAEVGDFLVIEPVRQEDWVARRSIRLMNSAFYFNLFSFLKKDKEGC
ncbi:hypothetical protein GCM10028806_00890 [Spirosoma terrae]|uniref:Uncharacterized protein n=1 Tax=Spirosoma terrae TaxID=1968276 RepID=A0A6L9LLI4_9BACT|nr:hypothetical protein [Spirosoma terrae]NDU97649.1 hypothetical protein [Spirosoma terrae]